MVLFDFLLNHCTVLAGKDQRGLAMSYYLRKKDFNQKLKEATGSGQLHELFSRECRWDWRHTPRDRSRLVNRAIELVKNVEQGCDLWNAFSGFVVTSRQDNRLLNKMVDLIKTEEELRRLYYILGCEEQEIERRNIIRRIFNKADRLRIKTI